MAAVRHFDYWKVKFLTAGREDMRQRANMCQRAKSCGDWSNRCSDMTIFRFFKMATATILDFQNVRNFMGGKGQYGQSASPCQILQGSVKPLRRHDDLSVFIPIWRPSAILHLLCCVWTTHRVFGGLYRSSKFGWNRCTSFDNMHVFRF